MSVILIASAGVVLVLGLVLVVRLHPLLALLLGSLFLLVLTPADILWRSNLVDNQVAVVATADSNSIGVRTVLDAAAYAVWDDGTPVDGFRSIDLDRIQTPAGADPTLVWYQAEGIAAGTIQSGGFLVASEAIQEHAPNRWASLGPRLTDGFSKTFRKLGIPVTMAAIVGVCLLRSGAANRLVLAIVALFGARGTAPALTASGFVLGVPVFFDTVFYLLLPLAKAVGRMRPERFLAAVMAIIVGATMAHSLVPPTPGPLFVVAQVNEFLPADQQVSVGMMMLGGFLVGGIAASVGFAYGMLCTRWVKLSPDVVLEPGTDESQTSPTMSLWLAVLPIALPIFFLGGSEIVEFLAGGTEETIWDSIHVWSASLNDPGLIFVGAALVAILQLRAVTDSEAVASAVAKGLSDAGVIVLLTCAGGAFGSALQQLELASAIGDRFQGLTSPYGLLITAFVLTAVIRFAQGSATVSMLTASAIVAPVLSAGDLPYHPIYVALAIGCGSKPLPWMNDSGFWQVTTMTGMKPTQTLKTFSVALTIMGVVGFAVTLLGARFFPLV